MKRRALDHAKLARHLGSQARGRVSAKSGYFGALELAAEVRRRFKAPASGGRATDPGWTAKRLIPMRPDTLTRLRELAAEVSRYVKMRVQPLQLAALLIECSVARPTAVRESLRGLLRFRGKAPWEGNLDELRERGRSRVKRGIGNASRGSKARDRVGTATTARAQSASKSASATPFPDRSTFRRSMPLLDPPISATLIEDRKDRS